MIKAEIDLDLGPAELAAAFWAMDNNQQALFFSELHKHIKLRFPNDEFGYGQWLYLKDGVKNLPEADRLGAANMIRTISSTFFQYLIGDSWDWERFDFDAPALMSFKECKGLTPGDE